MAHKQLNIPQRITTGSLEGVAISEAPRSSINSEGRNGDFRLRLKRNRNDLQTASKMISVLNHNNFSSLAVISIVKSFFRPHRALSKYRRSS
jgi:hypothetical protein